MNQRGTPGVAAPGGLSAIAFSRVGGVPIVVLAAIAVAWSLAIAAEAAGVAGSLHHDALIHSRIPYELTLAIFLLSWQAMIAAMMLPSSLPLIRLFASASANQPRPRAAMGAFLGGYALVWSVFGALAFSGDVFVHQAVDSSPWLRAHDYLIAGGTLALAGAFQFSSLKDACLRECRHPGAFLLRFYERGPAGAFRFGRRHGVFCAGCCWALMLLMFAAGVANLWWMAALTGLMVYEKTGPGGRRAVPIAGIALLALAMLVLAQPPGLSGLLAAR
jgi:predicted metal-binding membrane protein